MPDFISQFSGDEIDLAIKKIIEVNKNSTQLNDALDYTDNLKNNLALASNNELLAKKADGSLVGTGIFNEQDKIFFPKDGRFPSGSIDVGPAITISENGGWVQNVAHTLDKTYLMLDYEVGPTGTRRPIYWQRDAEEQNVIISPSGSQVLTLSSFKKTPSFNSQINKIYLDFASPVQNLCIEVVSKVSGKAIKYIPSESAWKNNSNGMDIDVGIQNILRGTTTTSFSALTSYELIFNFNQIVSLKGNENSIFLAVDRQKITGRGVSLLGEGTGSADSAEQIRDKLALLVGDARLSIDNINFSVHAVDGGFF